MSDTRTKVEIILKELIDPEVGMNVIDLGLLYDVREDEKMLTIEMIPTTAGCPLLDALAQGAEALLEPHFPNHQITILWNLEVEWTPDRINE